jgi:cell division protein FtsZ
MAVELKPRIVVIGVGGAGGNAVNNMIEANLQGVEFIAANTDAQALVRSKAPTKVQLGATRTEGLGAGANPDVGSDAAKESAEEIRALLKGAHMCFVAAGMGGGTGTGAAPIIARIARDEKVLTVGVVTKPFDFEGKRRMITADKGIAELRSEVDTLIIIPNQNLFRIANKETTFAEAFHLADRVLYSGVRSITDLMVMPGLINLDFADVKTVMSAMGAAMMGTGEAEGENRSLKAAQLAIANPLLDDVSMKGAKGVLINITGGYDMTLFEVDEAANEIRREVDTDAHIILGSTFDENMNGKIRVSVVAAGISQVAGAQARPVQMSPIRDSAPLLTPANINAPSPAAQLGLSASTVQTPAAPEPAPASRTGPIIRSRAVHVEEIEEPEEMPAPQLRAPEPRPEPRQEHRMVEPRVEPRPAPAAEPSRSGFSSLFGWKTKPAAEEAPAPVARPAPAADSFDDELEIPAFLRRSANS